MSTRRRMARAGVRPIVATTRGAWGPRTASPEE